MPKLSYFIKLALEMPFKKAVGRFFSFSSRIYREQLYKRKRLLFGRFRTPKVSLTAFTAPLEKTLGIGIDKTISEALIQFYCDHRFDLLGSGWVKNTYDSSSLGLEGFKYDMNLSIPYFDTNGDWLKSVVRSKELKKSREVWQLVQNENYVPIDWQKESKTGYRWSAKTYFKDCRKDIVGILPAVDIKVPWELSRMQHLTQMAAFSLSETSRKDQLIHEFRSQVLDFIASNPPQMGVCWTCTMDVAIRASNLIVAYNIFKQLDDQQILDTSFKDVLSTSIYEHGKHIYDNLEWHYALTSNHYLSNIAGLLFVSSFLPNENDIPKWFCFSANELLKEFDKQFYKDGASCEASTSYHRLSSEMIVYSTALLLGLPENKVELFAQFNHLNKQLPKKLQSKKLLLSVHKGVLKFPFWFTLRLKHLSTFSEHCTKQNGDVVQIGDNDSGRFIKLTPTGSFMSNADAENKYLNLKGYQPIIKAYEEKGESFWDENFLNHKTLTNAANSLFMKEPEACLEAALITCLSQKRTLDCKEVDRPIFSIDPIKKQILEFSKTSTYTIPKKLQASKDHSLKMYQYPNFGIVIIKSDTLFMSIMLGHREMKYCNWGHSHNDKLSVELMIGDESILTDPGTYIYTPLPKKRMSFALTQAHETCFIEQMEQNDFKDVFRVDPDYEISIENMTLNEISLCLKYKDIMHRREILLRKDAITIKDSSNYPLKNSKDKFKFFSNGYGKLSYKEKA